MQTIQKVYVSGRGSSGGYWSLQCTEDDDENLNSETPQDPLQCPVCSAATGWSLAYVFFLGSGERWWGSHTCGRRVGGREENEVGKEARKRGHVAIANFVAGYPPRCPRLQNPNWKYTFFCGPHPPLRILTWTTSDQDAFSHFHSSIYHDTFLSTQDILLSFFLSWFFSKRFWIIYLGGFQCWY